MSQFQLYRDSIDTALSTCVASSKDYRLSNSLSETPNTVIEQLVSTHITPLGGADNTLNIVILEGRPDWRKSATEVVFRKRLFHIVDSEQDEEHFRQIFDCLDMVLYCSELAIDILDAVIPLTLIEELFDVHTTADCEKIFDYVERRKTRLTINMVPGRGKGLVLLRMCNELLRRLSKEINTVFCGRILMFLANSFPLGERSGVNLRGDFNTDMIHYDSDETVDADTSMTDDQKSFYKLFWSTRKYFSNPPTVFLENNFEKLQEGTKVIIDRFQLIAQKEAEIVGARKYETSGMKRSRNEASMDEDPALAEQMLAEINKDYQFPRLLSSRKLLDLEMEDCRFRRNVIVQFLIIFQYLSGFSKEEKDNTADLLAARGSAKQSLVQPTYVLSDEQVEWINTARNALITLLRATKPHGNLYTDIILTILAHERHWIIWKASGCPAFEKPPINSKELEKAWLTKKPRLQAPPNKYRFSYGNFALTQLFDKKSLPLSEFMRNRPALPTSFEVIDNAVSELQDSLDSPQDRFNYANGALLQASRIIYRNQPYLIRQVYSAKRDVYKSMQEDKMKVDEPGEDTTDNKVSDANEFVVGKKVTEEHGSLIIHSAHTYSDQKQIIIHNHCKHGLQVGYQTNDEPRGRLVSLGVRGSYQLSVTSTWAGRVWARKTCNFLDSSCDIAGSDQPASLAEFRLYPISSNMNIDYYDVSFVDGFNLPVRIMPDVINGLDELAILDKKHCRPSECTKLPRCPKELQMVDENGRFVACKSACSLYRSDEFCCTGAYNSAKTCGSNHYARKIKKACPDSYSYAFDDATSVYGCRAEVYSVVFCPK
ncbi:THO complex subunit 1 transcription elongation factor-domain-containing protein [Pilobolus umbonatus]|nr:THO complex subunit 1 transcription elongation factor-domain-containing protein [Pilobolus umbonatus]